jgi:hypothetical protein
MTSFVLLNDMKAEASWALLGLTCRLAQSLGLHRAQPLDGRQTPDATKKETARRKLWYGSPAPASLPCTYADTILDRWTCVWHDTLTSLSFDR